MEDAVSFVKFPKHVLFSRTLSAHAKLLYAVLLGYAYQKDYCFPGYKRLCDDLQLSERTVRNAMRELVDAHLVACKNRGKKTNLYILCQPANIADQNGYPANIADYNRHNMPPNKKKGNNDRDRSNKIYTQEEREAYYVQYMEEHAERVAVLFGVAPEE
jgi:hypothetical protein